MQRTIRLFPDAPGEQRPGPAEDTESSGEGEITLWSWDDGNDDTWEGSINVERYGSDSAMAEGQLDIGTEDWWWYYTSVVWESSDEPLNQDVMAPPGSYATPSPRFRLATSVPYPNPPGYPYLLVRDWIQFFNDFRACVIEWCAAAAVGCIASGPAWPLCWGSACLGAQIGCFIDNYW